MDCSNLTSLSDFADYIDTLRSETEFKTAQLQDCRPEICQAVYGTGNPDISGIGVSIITTLSSKMLID